MRGAVSMALFGLAGVYCIQPPPTARAQEAARDLSGFVARDVVFTVTVTLDTPTGTIVAGVEEKPPAGWVVSTISHSGGWDELSGKVKWGPFFGASIPTLVTYELTAPAETGGNQCFSGTASFDGTTVETSADQCIAIDVPAASTWGLVALAALVTAIGGRKIQSRQEPTSG